MMKQTVRFRSKNRVLVANALGILEAEQPMTLRQLFYRLISAGSLANSPAEYSRLGKVMTRVREAEDIPRAWLVDHTRQTLKPPSWSDLAEFADTVRHGYRRDLWVSMPHHVEILVEKDAVAGTIQPVTYRSNVALRVCRGYSSVSFAGDIADFWAQIEKPIFAYFLGDFDPSGFDLERDLREKLQRYSGRRWEDNSGFAAEDNFVWRRLAVTQGDFRAHDLVQLPVKESDKRAAKFVRQHGTACAEIDAIPPTELRRRVQQAIDSHIDVECWDRLLQVESDEQETLQQFVEGLCA